MLTLITNGGRVMYITCPSCLKQSSFSSPHSPLICPHCHEAMPDGLDMSEEESERRSYHLDKEIYY